MMKQWCRFGLPVFSHYIWVI